MVVFGAILENNQLSKEFLKETKERLNVSDMVRNPFSNYNLSFKPITEPGFKAPVLLVGKLTPLYAKFYFIGLFWLGIAILFNRVWWSNWYIPGLFLFFIGMFAFSQRFFFFGFRQGLFKKGYKEKIIFLNHEKILNRWLD